MGFLFSSQQGYSGQPTVTIGRAQASGGVDFYRGGASGGLSVDLGKGCHVGARAYSSGGCTVAVGKKW